MATAQLERSSQGFRGDVQGLRAIAVGLVILYHYGLFNTTGGYVGVDVFFVISGFVIAGLIFREVESTGRVSLVTFYARRARRILPASTVTLVVTVCATVVIFGRLGAYSVAQDAVAAALFVANFHFAAQGTDYFAVAQPPSPLLHFWSLAVEEQFYFVVPSLVALVAMSKRHIRRHVGALVAVIVVASFVWSIIQTNDQPTSAYFSIATRAWELGIGVLLAAVTSHLGRIPARWAGVGGWIGVAAIAWSAWALNGSSSYPGSIAAIPVLGAAAIIATGVSAPRWGASRLLALVPMILVGDLSYSLYLWHFPVIALADRYYGGTLSLVSRLLLLVLAIVLAVASYRIVEQPIRNARGLRRLPARSLLLGLVCVGTSLAVAFVPIETVNAGIAAVVKGHPAMNQLAGQITVGNHLRKLPPATDPALALNLPLDNFGIPDMIKTCNPPTYVTTVRTCVYGDTRATATVVLYGNSQAQMWAPAFDQLGKEHHFRLIPIAKPACGTFIDPGYLGPIFTVSTICQRFVNFAIQRINHLHPNLVVVASTTGVILRPGADPNILGPNGRLPQSSIVAPPPRRVATSFQKFVNAIKPSGAAVVLMGDVPVGIAGTPAGISPTGCLLANPNNIQVCSLAQPSATNSPWRRSFLLASTLTKVPLIIVDPLLCANDRCPPIVNKVLVHFDELHVTSQYIRYTADALGELLRSYLPANRSVASRR